MPVILTVLLGVFGSGASDGSGLIGTREIDEREVVYWTPDDELLEVADDGEAGDPDALDEDPLDEEPLDEEPPDSPEPVEPISPVDDAVADAEAPTPPDASASEPSTVQRRVPSAKRQALARARARARQARAKRPKRELTKKQKRKIAKRKRKRERMAKRKQCDELSDQILKIDDQEWWFGREIANCYRTHLEQFDRLGGAWWKKNDRGKHIGVALSVSRSRRGEPARRAGFKTGDVIQSVNGLKVRSWGGVTIAATQLVRKRVKLKMIRDGEKQTITLRVVSPEDLEAKRAELEAVAEVP